MGGLLEHRRIGLSLMGEEGRWVAVKNRDIP
jgi:hypothetical protein